MQHNLLVQGHVLRRPLHGVPVRSALVLDATLEELIRNTPGGPQLNKLNNLRKKLKNAINGSPVAIIGVMKEISDAM